MPQVRYLTVNRKIKMKKNIAKMISTKAGTPNYTILILSLPCSSLVKKPATFVLQTLNQCLEVIWETSPPGMRSTTIEFKLNEIQRDALTLWTDY